MPETIFQETVNFESNQSNEKISEDVDELFKIAREFNDLRCFVSNHEKFQAKVVEESEKSQLIKTLEQDYKIAKQEFIDLQAKITQIQEIQEQKIQELSQAKPNLEQLESAKNFKNFTFSKLYLFTHLQTLNPNLILKPSRHLGVFTRIQEQKIHFIPNGNLFKPESKLEQVRNMLMLFEGVVRYLQENYEQIKSGKFDGIVFDGRSNKEMVSFACENGFGVPYLERYMGEKLFAGELFCRTIVKTSMSKILDNLPHIIEKHKRLSAIYHKLLLKSKKYSAK
jgi:hypothetical protein